jgi:L,D-transpeptidase ErfK/SrfK
MKSLRNYGLLLFLMFAEAAWATTYQLPATKGDTVIYQTQLGTATETIFQDETLLDVALRHSLGQTEIVRLNPKIDRWLVKKGQTVRLPNMRILPDTPRKGITLNISEFRMFYYPPEEPGSVRTYAHGIGRQDWKTPLGQTSVVRKIKDPVWHPPESIRKEHAANGDPLPEVVPAGPNNPLGQHALYLNLPGEYRIHGTDVNKIYGIGMQITHGCVRMYPEDIEALYNSVPIGTPVYLVKQPIKVGWLDNLLYVEAHPDLEGEEKSQPERYALAWQLIQKATGETDPEIDQKALNQVLKLLDGEPIAVYERAPPPPEPPEAEATTEAAVDPATTGETPKPSKPPTAAKKPAAAKKGSPGGYYRGL